MNSTSLATVTNLGNSPKFSAQSNSLSSYLLSKEQLKHNLTLPITTPDSNSPSKISMTTPASTNLTATTTSSSSTASSASSKTNNVKPSITIPEGLFDNVNQLSTSDRQLIIDFLSGNHENPNSADEPIKQIILHQEVVVSPDGCQTVFEQLIFEINYLKGTWRKLRRKRNISNKELLPLK